MGYQLQSQEPLGWSLAISELNPVSYLNSLLIFYKDLGRKHVCF